MSWFSQFSLVMRSSVTSLREKIEDPERLLHQLIIDMEHELDRVRASVAEAVADEIQMKKRTDRERRDAEKWLERASVAIHRGDEDSAKRALEQKLGTQQRADRYAEDHAKQLAEVDKLRRSVQDLEDKIRQAKQKKTLLVARMARATSSQKIHSAMERSNSQSAFSQFRRLEDKVDREEALNEAWDRLDGKDSDVEDLECQFEAAARKELLEIELTKLKGQIESNP
ncbi:MAG: PspA/IM30 family protein [Pirellula sp.]